MSDDKLHAVIHHFVGYRDRLLRITGIVIFHRNNLVAVDPTGLIEQFGSDPATGKLHITVLGYWTGNRTGNPDFDFSGYAGS